MGKGDTPRPKTVDQTTFAERWERAFGVPARICGITFKTDPNCPRDEIQLRDESDNILCRHRTR